MVNERVVMPRGEMKSPMDHVRVDVIRTRSLSVMLSFWKVSRYKMSVELPVSTVIPFTLAFVIHVKITKASSWAISGHRAFRTLVSWQRHTGLPAGASKVLSRLGVRPTIRRTWMIAAPLGKLILPTRDVHRVSLGFRLQNVQRTGPKARRLSSSVREATSQRQFTWLNYALRESAELEERVSGSGKLGVGVLESSTNQLLDCSILATSTPPSTEDVVEFYVVFEESTQLDSATCVREFLGANVVGDVLRSRATGYDVRTPRCLGGADVALRGLHGLDD
ncbi:hypothetical protein BHE74_00051010 [Ensete ventricosum]|nr:hypothetical protein BHE74_00051010 [Ensete ventricosum]